MQQWGPPGQPTHRPPHQHWQAANQGAAWPQQPHPSQPPQQYASQPPPQPPRVGSWNHACPRCGSTSIAKPSFTWWGGILGPRLLEHRVCNQCRYGFNGRTGYGSTLGIVVYTLAMLGLFLHVTVSMVDSRSVVAEILDLPLYLTTAVVLLGAAVLTRRSRSDAWGVLLAAGLIKLVDALVHWSIGVGIALAHGPNREALYDASRAASKVTGAADVIAVTLLAVALIRLAKPAVYARR